MYFFSLKKLKADLIEKPLTARVSLPYLIGTELAYAVAVEIGTIPPEASYVTSYNLWNVADSVISILATVLGILWLYHKNKGNFGSYFLQRFLAIGWVVGIWTILASLVPIIIIYAGTETTEKWTTGFLVIMFTTMYWFAGKQIAEVADKAKY